LILSAGFKDSGLKGVIKLPSELKLIVSTDHGNATCLSLQNRDLTDFSEGDVWIVPGSYGITQDGKIARCGKSAADYTAAFLTSELNASRLILWASDIRFSTADHHMVPEAEKIARLTYSEASELAYFDQSPLHPRTVEPLVKKHIPIHLINPDTESFDPETIINSEDYISPGIVKSVASTSDLSVLKLNGPGVGLKPGILAKITGKLTESAINIKSVITSQVSINIMLDRESGPAAVKAAEESGFAAVNEIVLLTNVSLIAIVGHGMQQNYGISATLFGAVAQNKINVLLSGSGASDLVSYLVVSSADTEMSVKAIHNAFFNSGNRSL
jgi:aspartate kinase/aspartokinase/homoserine dehydrogenase 1